MEQGTLLLRTMECKLTPNSLSFDLFQNLILVVEPVSIVKGAASIAVTNNTIFVRGVTTGILQLQFAKNFLQQISQQDISSNLSIVLSPFKNSLEGCTFFPSSSTGSSEIDLKNHLVSHYSEERTELQIQFDHDSIVQLNEGGRLQLIDFYR